MNGDSRAASQHKIHQCSPFEELTGCQQSLIIAEKVHMPPIIHLNLTAKCMFERPLPTEFSIAYRPVSSINTEIWVSSKSCSSQCLRYSDRRRCSKKKNSRHELVAPNQTRRYQYEVVFASHSGELQERKNMHSIEHKLLAARCGLIVPPTILDEVGPKAFARCNLPRGHAMRTVVTLPRKGQVVQPERVNACK